MAFSRKKAALIVTCLYVFFLSQYLLAFATEGDQRYYIIFYDTLPNLTFIDGYLFQKQIIDSYEPVFFLFYYLSSVILKADRVLVLSITNTALILLILNWVIKNKASTLLIPLILSNFYIMVACVSSERLKLSLLFIMLYFTTRNKFKILFLLMGVLSHLQNITFLISAATYNFLHGIKHSSKFKIKQNLLYSTVLFILTIAISTILKDHLIHKMDAYISQLDFENTFKILLFLLLTLRYTSKDKTTEVLSLYFPLLIAAFFLGGSRIAIIAYFIFMHYGLQVRKGLNLGTILTAVYFSIKGLSFLLLVIQYGDGFYRLSF